MKKDIQIGDLWWDENHCWSSDVEIVYLILSADMSANDVYLYRCSEFMWAGRGYCGANDRYFAEKEVLEMTNVGNIKQIKAFKRVLK